MTEMGLLDIEGMDMLMDNHYEEAMDDDEELVFSAEDDDDPRPLSWMAKKK